MPGRELCSVDFEDYRDWAHGNGIVLDAAGNRVIVSARHIDLLFAFRYEDDADGPSGELLWSIGPDGTLPLDGEPSYGLHAPELRARRLDPGLRQRQRPARRRPVQPGRPLRGRRLVARPRRTGPPARPGSSAPTTW